MTRTAAEIQLFAAVSDGPVRWRLLSGNNREVARGLASYADAFECERAVRHAQAHLHNVMTNVRRVDLHRWAWEARLDGSPIAVSGHSFDRQVRCKLAVAQFLEMFGPAHLRATINISGARRWTRAL